MRRYTTARLTHTLSPAALARTRYIAAGVVVGLVCFAFIADRLERARPAQTAEPQIVILIATPSPRPPLPTWTPQPTPAPIVIVQTVEVPVYVEVPAAPEPAPPTYAPPTQAPAIIGEVTDWDGNTKQIAP